MANTTIDISISDIMKNVFSDLSSHCKFMKVDESGNILSSTPVHVERVSFNKDAKMSVHWRFHNDIYAESLTNSAVNEISEMHLTYVQGIFTDESIASKIVKKHFKEIKQEKIADLENEIAKLKKNI